MIACSCERGPLHPPHTHDFPELFWLEEGCCRQRINGDSHILSAGELVPLRARDAHSLAAAVLRLHEPVVFAGGVAAFVRAAGRSHEHVTRTCRRFFGRAPAQLVNGRRMEFVEHQLRLCTRSITEIAFDCGFGATAQFYKLFRARYGVSPSDYRRRLRGEAVGDR